MPPKKRAAVTLDDVDIDFSAVAPVSGTAAAAASAAGPSALQSGSRSAMATAGGSGESLLRAHDPSLGAYVQRRVGAATGRRRSVFGGPSAALQQYQQQQAVAAAAAATTVPPSSDTSSSHPKGRSNSDISSRGGHSRNINDEDEEEVDYAELRKASASAAASFLTASLASLDRRSDNGQQQSVAEELAAGQAAYSRDLKGFCKQGLPWAASPSPSATAAAVGSGVFDLSAGQCNSLLCQLFAEGVPDIEPWDRWAFGIPRYEPSALLVKAGKPTTSSSSSSYRDGPCGLVHHPVLPTSHYTRHYQHSSSSGSSAAPVVAKLYKTKDELKAERRERLRRKQEDKRRATAAAAKEGGVSMSAANDGSGGLFVNKTTSLAHDRLSVRSLTRTLLGSSVLNPIAAEAAVLEQYQQRFLDHQQVNHDRHVAALPAQILKRERDAERKVAECPVLRGYRIGPIHSQAHLGKLRNFANDNRLRGFVLWVAGCDALLVLAGGEVAARHLDRWALHKMRWESEGTRAERLFSVPLPEAKAFSFHGRRKGGDGGGGAWGKRDGKDNRDRDSDDNGDDNDATGNEPVFINQCATAAEAEAFLRSMPAEGPWPNLAAVWRAAFLADGLAAA